MKTCIDYLHPGIYNKIAKGKYLVVDISLRIVDISNSGMRCEAKQAVFNARVAFIKIDYIYGNQCAQ